MRFFEHEAREIIKRAGIPVTDYGLARTPDEAGAIAQRMGCPVVIKSQVLTGGRMKAGGVRFADTPAQAEALAREILELEIGGQIPRGVLVDPRMEVEQELYAGVVWDGVRKRPVMIFSPAGGIEIELLASERPELVGRRHFSNILPFGEFEAKEVIAGTGVRARELTRLVPILTRLARLFVETDLTLAEINPLGRLADGSFVALDAHLEIENEARGRHRQLLGRARRRRAGDPPGPRGDALRAGRRAGGRPRPPRRGGQPDRVRRRPGARDRGGRRLPDPVRCRPCPRGQARELLRDRRQPLGRQGLRAIQAGPAEARRGQDRGDDVRRLEHARRHHRPGRHQGLPGARRRSRGEDRDLPCSRGPGRRRASRSSSITASSTWTAACH